MLLLESQARGKLCPLRRIGDEEDAEYDDPARAYSVETLKELAERVDALFPTPRLRARRCTPSAQGILQVLSRAYHNGVAVAGWHGGGVANKYGYPASTECWAVAASRNATHILLGLGASRMPANKATEAGAVRNCLLAGGFGPWWLMAQNKQPATAPTFSQLAPDFTAEISLDELRVYLVARVLRNDPVF